MSEKKDSFGIDLGVWDRTGLGTMSRQYFNLLYGGFTLIGLLVTAIGSYFTQSWVQYSTEVEKMVYTGPNLITVSIGVLIVGIIGIVIAMKSENPAVSFIGFMLVAAPFGLIVGPFVALYTPASVFKVVVITISLVGVLTIIGATIKDSLENWGSYLFAGLVVLLIGSIGLPFLRWLGVPVEGAMTLFDWIGVLLFSAYVVYDVNRAQRVPATADNAVDCALSLYLDIINLFLRLLRLMGQKK